MPETSSSKRRVSTPPTPSICGAAANTSSQSTKRPPRKKGKKKALGETPQSEESTSHVIPQLSKSEQRLPAEGNSGQSLPNSSTQSTSFPSHDALEAQVNQTSTPEPPAATPRPPQGIIPIQAMTTSGRGFTIPESGLPEEDSGGPRSDTSAFINHFVLDAMSLSPSSFPPVGIMLGSPPSGSQHPPGHRGLPNISTPQSNTPIGRTPLMGPVYPDIISEMETGVYGGQLQQQQTPPTWLFAQAAQPAVPTPIEGLQTSPSEVPALQIPAYMDGGVQQAHFSPANFMPAYRPALADPDLFVRQNHLAKRRSSIEPHTPPVQAGMSSYQLGTPPSEAHRRSPNPRDIPTGSFAQQAFRSDRQQSHLSPPSTSRGSLQWHQDLSPPFNNKESTSSWTIPTTDRQDPVSQPATPRQERPTQNTLPLTQQLTSLNTLLSPPPHPNTQSYDLTTIDPLILPPHDLWTQLETAQHTIIGTLLDLIRRGRDGEVEPGLEDHQVRNVTANLINVMSLWYLLRRERGWDL